MRKFSLEELKRFSGENGGPVYLACNGKVYDVSASPLWEDGQHQEEHEAGMDLTAEMAGAPHEPDLLDDFPIVGELE